jgi:hypothetical protein
MNEEIVDWLGNILHLGDLVIYADNWPIGRQPYIGKISHVTAESGRIALRVLKSTWHPKVAGHYQGYSVIDKEVLENLEFEDKASVYRVAVTLIKYEKRTK